MPVTIDLTCKLTAHVEITIPSDGITISQAQELGREAAELLNAGKEVPDVLKPYMPPPGAWVIDDNTDTDWDFQDAHR
jgi:hypothetical protein